MAMQKACGQVEECGVKSLLVQGDVSQEEDIIDMVNTVVEQFGSLDILINNAGIQKEIQNSFYSGDLFSLPPSTYGLLTHHFRG